MTSPAESAPSSNEIQTSEILRDTAWSYLPERARNAPRGVTVTWLSQGLSDFGAAHSEVRLRYTPITRLIDISVTERIFPTPEAGSNANRSYYSRSITINGETGDIQAYFQGAETYDTNGELVGDSPLSEPQHRIEEWMERQASEGITEDTTWENLDDRVELIAREHFEEESMLYEAEKAANRTFRQEHLDYLLKAFERIDTY